MLTMEATEVQDLLKGKKRKKALISLPPFGRILADSPTQNINDDNM